MIAHLPPLVVVVGSGGVGKTSLAAALGLLSAGEGQDTLVMTFDPSLRLKDSLGVGEAARDEEVEVAVETPGRLAASLLDARRTFDRLVERYAEDPEDQKRILENRYYRQLAGSLAGILEYMAVERLFEVFDAGRYDRIVLDTPPTRQALDFLEAPERIVAFLDSGALKLALKPWFDSSGHLKATTRLGRFGAKFEEYLDEVVGLDLLRDMAEFFQAFAPLYDGFRQRAVEVQQLLGSPRTLFVLVAAPGEERNSDTLFFARRLQEAGYRLGPIVVNRIHPRGDGMPAGTAQAATGEADGRQLLAWLGQRDARGLAKLQSLLSDQQPLVGIPLLPREPADLASLGELAREFATRFDSVPS